MTTSKSSMPRFSNLIQAIFFALALTTLPSCAAMMMGALGEMGNSTDPEMPDFDFENEAATINFTILQLNDVYEIGALDRGKVGGMARVATVRQGLLSEGNDVLTVLAGDFLSPSLLGTLKYEGERVKGRQMVEVMNEMGVNLVVFGNHEFDIKEGELQARMNESYFDWLGTNVLHQTGTKLEPFYKESFGFKYFSPETYTWEVTDYMSGQTLKIGIYGATINSNPVDWVYYEDPFQEATKAYLELTGTADIILGLTHLDLEQDLKMAALLPKTALIMGGHEHENSMDTIGNVVIAKADANAKSVYVHRFTYETTTKVLSLTSELVPINNEIEDEATIAAIVERWQQIQHDQILEVVANPDDVIFNAETPLDGREASVRNKQTNLGGLIAAGMAAAAKKPVDCAFFNGGSIRLDDQLQGDITAVDIFRALPFGGAIHEIEVKGSILKKALVAGMENAGLGGYLQWHNISFDEATKVWKINGQTLSEGKTYRLVTNEYVANGKEMRLEFFNPKNFTKWETPKEGDNTDLRSDLRKAVVAYLKSK